MVHYLNNYGFGINKLTEIDGINSSMLMDVYVEKLNKGSKKEYLEEDKEMAVLLLTGKIEIKCGEIISIASRNSVFDEEPYCIHVPKNTSVSVEVLEDSEILIQCTENENKFEAKLYTPKECISVVAGDDVWNNTARRVIRTVFDYSNAPYSNMVMGEVITYPGRWSSYPPHYHPQPEVYFYKFNKPQGFGFCLTGEEAYKIKDNSFATIEGGLVHPQCSAPGYAMYYCWMIRHLKNNPWTERIDDEDHKWLLKKDVIIWPEK